MSDCTGRTLISEHPFRVGNKAFSFLLLPQLVSTKIVCQISIIFKKLHNMKSYQLTQSKSFSLLAFALLSLSTISLFEIGNSSVKKIFKANNKQYRRAANSLLDEDEFPYSQWDRRVKEALSESQKLGTDYVENRLHKKPLNVLALGGSVTWGGYIPNRYNAFPFLLGHLHKDSKIDNLAIRATGATFPASCIQSMLEGDGAFPEYDVAPGTSYSMKEEEDNMNESLMQVNSTIYDVILLEFSINGVLSTEFLITRLKQRFPDALIIYVHLESLTHPVDKSLTVEYFEKLMEPSGGLYYMLPKQDAYEVVKRNLERGEVTHEKESDGSDNLPDFLSLYADDEHHLSELGHKFIANEIMKLLYDHLKENPDKLPPLEPSVGTWGGGDHCYMWLSSWGYFPESLSSEGGGKFAIFDELKKKYSYEIEYGEHTSFEFERKDLDGKQIPIHLVYMTLVRMKLQFLD